MVPCRVGVEVFDGTGRGQAALEPLKAGDVVLEVPLSECWTAAAALASPELACLRDAGVGEVDLVALHLLAHRAHGASGPRAAHVESMPEKFDLPLLWSPDELTYLEGTARYGLAVQMRKQAESDYWSLDQALLDLGGEAASVFESHSITLGDYLWARCAIQSRSTKLDDPSGGESRLLCLPSMGADMFNHSPDIKGESFRLTSHGTLQVLTQQDVQNGSQVFISYGSRLSTAQMLFRYGFAPEANLSVSGLGSPLEQDKMFVEFVVPEVCSSAEEAAKHGLVIEAVTTLDEEEHKGWQLDAGEDGSVHILFNLRPTCPLPNCWLVSARIMQLEPDQAEHLRESSDLMGKVLAGRPISRENEQGALASLSLEVMTKMDAYDGTAALLGQLGGAGLSSDRMRLAVNLRMVEKAILQLTLDEIQEQTTKPVEQFVF